MFVGVGVVFEDNINTIMKIRWVSVVMPSGLGAVNCQIRFPIFFVEAVSSRNPLSVIHLAVSSVVKYSLIPLSTQVMGAVWSLGMLVAGLSRPSWDFVCLL